MSTPVAFSAPAALTHVRAPPLFLGKTNPLRVRTVSTRIPRTRRAIVPTCGLFDLWNNPKSDEGQGSSKLGFEVGYTYLAHPEKQTGEDAFFVEGTSIGVFDGVSGSYDTRGVDPRLYSQQLAASTSELVKIMGPGNVVKAAIEAASSNEQIGASTACVVGMDRVGRIFGVNLGDSGVRIVRDGKMVFRTKEQQHFFNCPYQLGTDSEDGLAMGQNIQQKARVGDVMIIASDGLWDNVPNNDVVSYVGTIDDMMTLAETLGELASKRGIDTQYESPFMLAAIAAGESWRGGKPDDITVVTARVVQGDAAQQLSLLSTIPEAQAAGAEAA